jgi:hypothetical protein
VAARAQQGDRPRRIGMLLANDENNPLTKLRLPAISEAKDWPRRPAEFVAALRRGLGAERIPVPNPKMKWDAGNPTGHGIILIGPRRQVYCYVTPSGLKAMQSQLVRIDSRALSGICLNNPCNRTDTQNRP